MHFSTSATSMGKLSLTKSSGMVQVSKGTASRMPAQILKNTEQIAHKIFVQNLNCRNFSQYNPPRGMTTMVHNKGDGPASECKTAQNATKHAQTRATH